MQEIEALYFPEGTGESKACWFPFKKAYYTRRIVPGGEEHAGALVLQKPVQIPLLDDHVGLEELVPVPAAGNRRSIPFSKELRRSFLTEAETNSVITEYYDDQMIDIEKSVCQNLAEINANPMSRQFWVDEMVDGGSLNCGKSSTSFRTRRVDPDASSYAGISLDTRGMRSSIQDIAVKHQKTPGYPRIEVEYDFNTHASRNRSAKTKSGEAKDEEKFFEPVNHGSMGGSRASTSMGSSSLAKCSPFRFGEDHSTASGSLGSDWDALSSVESFARKGRSFGSKDDTIQKANSLPSAPNDKQVVPTATKESSASKRRLLCGAMTKPRLTLGHRESDIPTARSALSVGKDPSARKVRPTLSTRDNIEDVSDQNAEGATAVKRSGQEIQLPQTAAMALAGCMSSITMGALLMAQSASGCNPSSFMASGTNLTDQDDDPHFFVEVEAKKRQLQEIKDLDEIILKEEKLLKKTHDMARKGSLVDDDSAFMGKPCMSDMLDRFSQKRPPSGQAPPSPGKLRHTSAVPLGKSEEKSGMSPSLVKSSRSVVPGTPDRIVKPLGGEVGASRRDGSSPPSKTSRKHRHTSSVPLGKTEKKSGTSPSAVKSSRRVVPVTPDGIVKPLGGGVGGSRRAGSSPPSKTNTTSQNSVKNSYRKGRRGTRGNASGLMKNVDDGARQMATQSSHQDSTNRTKALSGEQKNLSKEEGHQPKMTVIHLKSRPQKDHVVSRNSEKPANSVALADPVRDFELARFPSLTSEDWCETSLSKSASIRPSNSKPSWAEGYGSDEDLGPQLDPDVEYMRVGASTIDSGFSFKARSKQRAMARAMSGMEPQNGLNEFDGDDDDSLNTDAFRRYAIDADADSIFHGLGSARSRRQNAKHVDDEPPRRVETKRISDPMDLNYVTIGDSASIVSKELSKYTSHTETSRSKTSRSTLRSKQSPGRSVVSRGDLTSLTGGHSEPMLCIDTWL